MHTLTRRSAEHDDREWRRGFAHRLRVNRIALGLTEEEAAAVAGRTVETWRRYEATGEGHITGPLLLFAERYKLSLDWLFGGRGRLESATGKVVSLPTSRKAVQS
jgi:hypothetical protein